MIDEKIREAWFRLSLRSEAWALTIADAYVNAEARAREYKFWYWHNECPMQGCDDPHHKFKTVDWAAEVRAELEKP